MTVDHPGQVRQRKLGNFDLDQRPRATGEPSRTTAFNRFRGLSATKTLDQTRPALEKKSTGAWLMATFLGIGHLRPGPGTYASAVTVFLWWSVAGVISSRWQLSVTVVLALAGTAVV